jgi:hypothetical protein
VSDAREYPRWVVPRRRNRSSPGKGRNPYLAPAVIGEPQLVLTDVTTHPEMLAIARLLISSQRAPGIRPQDIAARLGFPYPGSPHPLDPLQSRPSRLPRANGGAMAINIPARLRDEDFATCLVKRYLAPTPQRGAHATPARTLNGWAVAETGQKPPASSPPRTC